jgi:hypothetical protein
MYSFRKKAVLPDSADILPGRSTALRVPEKHFVNGNRIVPPFPAGTKLALFGLGCFWGAERKFWQIPGVCQRSFKFPHLRSLRIPHPPVGPQLIVVVGSSDRIKPALSFSFSR